MTFSDRLREQLVPLQEQRLRAWAPLVNPRSFGLVYRDLLIQTFYYVKYSCPLMQDALAVLPPRLDGLRRFLIEHLEEERDHDRWLLNDLERLGTSEADVFAIAPCPAVASLVGCQMYMTRERGGASVLGYMFVLEATPPDYNQLQALVDAAGIPRAAAFTFLEHARLDAEHGDDICLTLDDPEFTSADHDAIGLSAELTLRHLIRFGEQLRAGVHTEVWV